jgi:hypothetical protein
MERKLTLKTLAAFEEFYLLGHNAMQFVENEPMFPRNMSPPSSG